MIKIAITGPESTGKSWLSSTLAQIFGVPWVPEFAREYLSEMNRPYILEDVIFIAQMQRNAEKLAAQTNPPILFCDTDMIVCKIWCEVKYGFCPPEIQALRLEDDYNLYLLTDIDLPGPSTLSGNTPISVTNCSLFIFGKCSNQINLSEQSAE